MDKPDPVRAAAIGASCQHFSYTWTQRWFCLRYLSTESNRRTPYPVSAAQIGSLQASCHSRY